MRKILIVIVSIFILCLQNQKVFAGCNFRDGLNIFTFIKPYTECISTQLSIGCQGQFDLVITSKCTQKYFIFDDNDKKLILPSSYDNSVNESDILENFKVYGIPETWKWQIKLVNTENKDDIIYINGLTYPIFVINILYVFLEVIVFLFTFKYIHKHTKIKKIHILTLLMFIYLFISGYIYKIFGDDRDILRISFDFIIVFTGTCSILSIAKFLSDKLYKNKK